MYVWQCMYVCLTMYVCMRVRWYGRFAIHCWRASDSTFRYFTSSAGLRLCSRYCDRSVLISVFHRVSKNRTPFHFQITPTSLVRYEQVLVQRIIIYSALNFSYYFVKNIKNVVPAEVFLWYPLTMQLPLYCGCHREPQLVLCSWNVHSVTSLLRVDCMAILCTEICWYWTGIIGGI